MLKARFRSALWTLRGCVRNMTLGVAEAARSAVLS